MTAERKDYPICPWCKRQTIVGAMMTSRAMVIHKPDTTVNARGIPSDPGELYYHPDAISVYCCAGDCNYDQPLANLPHPPPRHECEECEGTGVAIIGAGQQTDFAECRACGARGFK